MRDFLKTYVVALLGFAALALLGLLVVSVQLILGRNNGGPPPPIAKTEPYTLTYATVGAKDGQRLVIDAEGAACTALSPSDKLYRACVLSTNLDPAVIASDAHGDLNVVDTPAFMAIVWRARLLADPSICDAGGLLDDRLALCHAEVLASTYEVNDNGITVTIGPSSTPSG